MEVRSFVHFLIKACHTQMQTRTSNSVCSLLPHVQRTKRAESVNGKTNRSTLLTSSFTQLRLVSSLPPVVYLLLLLTLLLLPVYLFWVPVC